MEYSNAMLVIILLNNTMKKILENTKKVKIGKKNII